jgi:hypothetical protein
MHAAFPLTFGALALAGCAAPVPQAVPGYRAEMRGAGLAVMRDGTAFANWEGAEAKRAANAICGGAVRGSVNDHFDAGAWVFVEGCA